MMDMDRSRKIMATASCQAQGACTEPIVDRFSDLPVEVAHHIFTFLAIRDIAQVGCLSKRCLEFHLTFPTLRFDLDSHPRLSMWKRLEFFNCFDSFMAKRGDNKIKCFYISWTDNDVNVASRFDEHLRISTLIRHAIRCNVEVFHLQLTMLHLKPLALPSCFFLCKSLTSLLMSSFEHILKWPSSACFANLRYLNLVNVRIVGGELFCKWILSCKFLRKLKLDNVGGIKSMTVESSCLESFSFVNTYRNIFCHLSICGERLEEIHLLWRFEAPCRRRSLNIFARNLKYLKWGGNLMDLQKLGNLMCLEEAEILLEPNVDESDKVFEVLRTIRRVKVLILNEVTFKVLFKKGSMPASLNGISYLGLCTWSLNDDLVRAIVCLLSGLTNLRKLCIHPDPSFRCWPLESNDSSSTYNTNHCGSHNLGCMHQLQEAIIEISNGSNEFELAKYILEHAPNLKKLVILYRSRRTSQLEVFQNSQKEVEMEKKAKMLSNAKVVFQKW